LKVSDIQVAKKVCGYLMLGLLHGGDVSRTFGGTSSPEKKANVEAD